LLAAADRRAGVTAALGDRRDPVKVRHPLQSRKVPARCHGVGRDGSPSLELAISVSRQGTDRACLNSDPRTRER
jgi:hypothetical protein